MNKKIVIIIPNENKTKAGLYTSKGTIKYHKEAIEKYIYQNEISLTNYNFYDLNNIYFELIEQGFSIINIDEFKDIKNAIIYLPEKISKKQLEYFEQTKEILKTYQIGIQSIKENQFIIIKELETEDNNLETLYTELNNRLTQPKTLIKKKDNNEE